VREGTTVIKWKPDQTYDTVTKGTNGLVFTNGRVFLSAAVLD